MSISTLRKLHSNVHSTNNEQPNIVFLAKFTFFQDLADIKNMSAAMKWIESAIRAITTVKFYENYLTEMAGCRGTTTMNNWVRLWESFPKAFGKRFPKALGNVPHSFWE